MRRMAADPVDRTGPGGRGAVVSPGCMVKTSVIGWPLTAIKPNQDLSPAASYRLPSCRKMARPPGFAGVLNPSGRPGSCLDVGLKSLFWTAAPA